MDRRSTRNYRRYRIMPASWAVRAGIVLAVAAAGSGIGYVVYADVTAPTHGTIISRDYEPESSYWVFPSKSCSGTGRYRSCVTDPGYWQDVPAEYKLELRDCSNQNGQSSCNVGWHDVDEHDYDKYMLGEYYPG